MPAEELAMLALGPMWPRLSEACDAWFDRERKRLQSAWPPNSIDDKTLLSFELGLYLHSFGEPEVRYESTPEPGWVFARTGGDGEHLSVLTADISPRIVLTAPMAFGSENLIVGDSLEEFLSFLCHVGPSNLVSICYRGGVGEVRRLDPFTPTELYAWLISELGLAAPPDPLQRLHQLAGF